MLQNLVLVYILVGTRVNLVQEFRTRYPGVASPPWSPLPWLSLRPYLRGCFRQKPAPHRQNFMTVYPNFALWGGGLSKILQSSSHVNVNSENHHLLGPSKTSNKSSAQLRVRSPFFFSFTQISRLASVLYSRLGSAGDTAYLGTGYYSCTALYILYYSCSTT